MEEMIEHGCFLRLFLDSKWSADSMMRYWDATQRERARGLSEDLAIAYAIESLEKQMRGWFPVTFTVTDACLSNSDSVWLAKRVYL